ncbi:ATP-grasp domain-containing protein [Parapedobacter koreensis]|nr:hypothetical protein [Parapedobacter koreensis]
MLITQGMRPFAQRVANQLSERQRKHVLFGSSEEMPQVLLRLDNYLKIPQVSTAAFAHEMLKTCLDKHVAILIPLGVDELYPLAEARQLFSEYGITICVPSPTELAELAIIENPPKQLPLLLLHHGRPVVADQEQAIGQYGTLSGVFSPADSGDELALCCVAD